MAIFSGARIEVHDGLWGVDHDEHTEFGRSLEVWGRTASGAVLTQDDAQCRFGEEDVDILVDNDGSVTFSLDGLQDVLDWLAEAFPGADIHYYDESAYGGELDHAENTPIFEVEYTWTAPRSEH